MCGGKITRDETLCIVDDGANPLVQRMSEVEGTIRMRILCFEISKVSKVSRSFVIVGQTVVSLHLSLCVCSASSDHRYTTRNMTKHGGISISLQTEIIRVTR